MPTTSEGELLWTPSDDRRRNARVTSYVDWLREKHNLDLTHPADDDSALALWRWSVDNLDDFWSSVWDYFGIRASAPYDAVLADARMPGAVWFPGARLSYAEHALAWTGAEPALVFRREDGLAATLSRDDLRAQVGAAAAGLRRLGVREGDRVAAVLPNAPQAVIAFLAAASIGAIWSSCSPDFGARGLVDRFAQINPTVLLTVDGYLYGGRAHRIVETISALQAELTGLAATVVVPYLDDAPDISSLRGTISWTELVDTPADPAPVPLPFDAPLWILYSSGTTGLPKPIVQSQGGILLEHVKCAALHTDLRPGDRFFWFTTTGWMMWNYLLAGLLVGSTCVLYDGSPGHPDMTALWRFAGEVGITSFGTSAPYLTACLGAGVTPREIADLTALKSLGSTGAPLSPEGFRWVYDNVKADLHLASVSGGTDVCTAFVLGLPTLPVRAGEIQTRALGCAMTTYDASGREVTDEVGELVVTKPMPSMPIRFWGDDDGSRLTASYFADFPGVWRHGDWAKVTAAGHVVIYGRSDSTLNRGGVRIGTAEFYRVVEELPEITESLVVDTSELGREGELLLFVVLTQDTSLDDGLLSRIRAALRTQLSPRHVPDVIEAVTEIPRTLNGKKLEVPVKRMLAGTPLDKAVSIGAVANPTSLDTFVELATRRAGS
ncbi:MAG: acetoacetate--CoA ligase [Actinomycetes bacterium]